MGIARQVFSDGVEVLFDARLRPEVDEARQAQSEEELWAKRASIGLIVAECRAGTYGTAAMQVIKTLRRQAGVFIDVEKNCHGLVSRPNPLTKRYEDETVQRAWGDMQITIAQLERQGADFGEIPEWEVAAMLISLA